jgi:zinc transporter ZupT
MCGPVEYYVVVHFDGSSATPTVGETITGVTTLDTGKVSGVTMGGTSGVMILNSPTGYDAESSVMFQDNEALTGSISGVGFAFVDGACGVSKSGRMFPDKMLIEYQGKKYCQEHFYFRFQADWVNDAKVDITENLRGK